MPPVLINSSTFSLIEDGLYLETNMKRTIFWLLVSVFTFALGVAIVFVWLDGHKSPNQQSEAVSLLTQEADIPNEMPILAYCELANNPEKYNGEVVRVRTKLDQFIHGGKRYL